MNKIFLAIGILVISLVACTPLMLIPHDTGPRIYDCSTRIDLSVADTDVYVTQGQEKTLLLNMRNAGDSAYVFVEVESNSDTWSIETPAGWSRVGEQQVYAYGNEKMIPLDSGADLNVSFNVKIKDEGFEYLTDDDCKVSVTAKAVSAGSCGNEIEECYSLCFGV